MNNLITVGYTLYGICNHAYFFDDAPDNVFCDQCGCCIDGDYLPKELKLPNRADVSYTYDHRCIVSQRFKEFIETLGYKIDFLPVNQNKTLFLMKPVQIIKYSAYQLEKYCEKCHQYQHQVAPSPDFYDETGKVLQNGIFFTSTAFGSGIEKWPIIVLGVETAKVIGEAVKKFKFRGADITPIEIGVKNK